MRRKKTKEILIVSISIIMVMISVYYIIDSYNTKSNSYNIKIFYLYHYDDDIDPNYKTMITDRINQASDIIRNFTGKTYNPTIEKVKIDSFTFGHGDNIIKKWFLNYSTGSNTYMPEFFNMTTELAMKSSFDDKWCNYYETWFVLANTTGGAVEIRSVIVFSEMALFLNETGIIVHENLHNYGCGDLDDSLRQCFMVDYNLPLNNDTLNCDGCLERAFNDYYHYKSLLCTVVPEEECFICK